MQSFIAKCGDSRFVSPDTPKKSRVVEAGAFQSILVLSVLRRLTIHILTIIGIAGTAHAASFDCTKASSKMEKTICSSASLSSLDSKLAEAYSALLSKHSDPEGVKKAQRAWLGEIRTKCQDEACFSNEYEQRLAAIASAMPKEVQAASSQADLERKSQEVAPTDALAKQQAEEAVELELKKQAAEALDAEAQRKAEEAAAAETARQAAVTAAAVQAKQLADKAAADRQQIIVIASSVIAACIVMLLALLLLRRRSQRAKATVGDANSVPAAPPVLSPETNNTSSYVPKAMPKEASPSFDIEKATASLNKAPDQASSAASSSKLKISGTATQMRNGLANLKKAKDESIQECAVLNPKSKIKYINTLFGLFWKKLSKTQQSIISIVIIIVFISLWKYMFIITMTILLAAIAGVVWSVIKKRTSLGEGLLNCFLLLLVTSVVFSFSDEAQGKKLCDAKFEKQYSGILSEVQSGSKKTEKFDDGSIEYSLVTKFTTIDKICKSNAFAYVNCALFERKHQGLTHWSCTVKKDAQGDLVITGWQERQI